MKSVFAMVSLAAMLAMGVGAAEDALSRVVATMDDAVPLNLDGEAGVVAEGPAGEKVLRLAGPCSGRVDLGPLNLDPKAFDLLKIEVKTDAHAHLRISLENYPNEGDLAHWYVLDGARGAIGWRTIWVDLRRPEEIKAAGTYKGMEAKDAARRGLLFATSISDTKRAIQEAGCCVWLGRLRLVQQAVALDWDQRQVTTEGGTTGRDLVANYPLTVTNRLDRPLTAALRLVPFRVRDARAVDAPVTVELAARATATVTARVTLPAAALAGKPPLYTELFEARVSAAGVADSEVTILRSSDPIHLGVTVPVPEDKLAFPLLPRRRDVPAAVTGFGADVVAGARAAAAATKPDDLDFSQGADLAAAAKSGMSFGGDKGGPAEQASGRYLRGLTACAFLYDATGEKAYLDQGTALLKRAADLWPARTKLWADTPVIPISHGIFGGNTLRLGWALGSMRPPYLMQLHGMFNDFDLLAKDMDPDARRHILANFLLPAAIHMRNHYFGLNNQQDVVNYPVLYAGLATRNWPLAAFATHSEHGVLSQLMWNFDDDGLCAEGHYQLAAVRPILWAAELLHGRGPNLYDERLFLILHSPAGEAAGIVYRDSIKDWLDQQRFPPALVQAAAKQDPNAGLHNDTGTTLLRWQGLQVGMNWGTQLHRGALDRCALRLVAPEKHPLAALPCGGGNYTHSSLGQSIIIVDEGAQDTKAAKVTAHQVTGPVQFVQAVSAEHFPGATITRTFALVDRHVLVLDRVVCDQPRLVDWCLRFPGGGLDADRLAKLVALPLVEQAGSFTDKPGLPARGVEFGARVKRRFVATTDAAWQVGDGKLTMLGAPRTEVMAFTVGAAFSASAKERATGVPVLMARRRAAKETTFAACFSGEVKSLAAVPLEKVGGGAAQGVAVRVELKDGKTFLALANGEADGVKVRAGTLETAARFATDYAAEAKP